MSDDTAVLDDDLRPSLRATDASDAWPDGTDPIGYYKDEAKTAATFRPTPAVSAGPSG